MVEDLFGERLVSGQTKGCGEFLADDEAHGVKLRLAAALAFVGQRHRRLHDVAVATVDVKLAAGEPAEVGGVGRIEKQ